MAWVRMDDKFPRGPKVKRAALALGGKYARARILAAWVDVMGYCNLNETDGFIPDFEVTDLDDPNPTAVMTAMCVGAGETPGPIADRDDTRKGWQIRNYTEYQPSRAELESKREADRLRKMSRRNPQNVRADKSRTPHGQNEDPHHPDRTGPDRTDPDRSLGHASSTDARPATRGYGAGQSGFHNRNCWGPPEACRRGLCVPLFLGQQWQAQDGSIDATAKFITEVVDATPPGTSVGDDLLAWWKAQRKAKFGSVVNGRATEVTQANRAVADRVIEQILAQQPAGVGR